MTDPTDSTGPTEPRTAAELRGLLNKLKASYVQGYAVDYQGLKQSLLWGELKAELKVLAQAQFDPTAWPQATQRAFWINLYNVLVFWCGIEAQTLLPNWLNILFNSRFKRFKIGAYTLSLDDLEHGILRGNRRHPYLPLVPFAEGDPRRALSLPLDPRIHFALNCGAKSCPPIGVYDGEKLENQLEQATRSYLHSEVGLEANTLYLPTLLKWYAADFGGREGIAGLLEQYVGLKASELIQFHWRYKQYDWRSNHT